MKRATRLIAMAGLVAGVSAAAPAPGDAGTGTPSTGVQRFVVDVFALRLESRKPKARPIERLPIGTALWVGPPEALPSGEVLRPILSGGRKAGGFVADRVLSDSPPNEASLVRAAEGALAEGRVADAEKDAERARALDPSAIEPRQILAGLFDVQRREQSARRVYAELAGLHAPRSEPPDVWEPDAGAPVKPGPAFASATRLRVRAQPAKDSPVVAEAPINGPLEVLGVDAGWARVRLETPTREPIDLRSDAWAPQLEVSSPAQWAEQEGRVVEGWAAAGFLSREPLEKDDVVRAADLLERSHRPGVLAALERAALLDPDDRSLLGRVARLAIQTRRWQLAAWAATRMDTVARGGGGRVQLELFYGCRGPTGPAAARLPASTDCVAEVDPLGPCEPCPISEMDYDSLTPKELRAQRAEDEAQRRQWQADYTRERAAWRRKFDRIEPLYADGPWLKASLTGSAGRASTRLYAYAVPFQRLESCTSDWDREKAIVSRRGLVFPPPGQTADVWIRVPTYLNTVYGLVEAVSAGEAFRTLQEWSPADSTNPLTLGPPPNVTGSVRDCSCCGC